MPPSHPGETSSFDDVPSLLLECASAEPDPRRVAKLIRFVDWPRLLGLAEEHGVVAHLAARLSELDEVVIPAEMKQMLLEWHHTQLFFALIPLTTTNRS